MCKTTLATHLAARWARFGCRTVLLDLDRQRAAFEWVARRPASLPTIRALQADSPHHVRAAQTGVTVFDQPEWCVRPRLAEWAPIVHFTNEHITAEPA